VGTGTKATPRTATRKASGTAPTAG
jgi:hypothetical protein